MTERKLRKHIQKAVPIETERLILRYIESNDANDMYEYASREDVCEFLLWEPHINVDATKGYIDFLKKRYSKGLYADWAIELKEKAKMIGTCGFANINTAENIAEIGYVLSPFFRKKGFMTEAVCAIIRLSFEILDFDAVKLRIMSENERSIKLAEKLGFERSDLTVMEVKGKKRDIAHYILTKDEYDKTKKEAVD